MLNNGVRQGGDMLIRDVGSWPPALTDSQTMKVVPSSTAPARLKRCGLFSAAGQAQPYLSIVVEYQGHDCHAMINDLAEPMMRRIEATLKSHLGEPLAQLGELEIVQLP